MNNMLPSEHEIISSWLYNDKVYITCICFCYNHENYISTAIDSILSQETKYRFEVIIHDDASQDQSIKIIEDYRKKYPNIIKLIKQKNNQYSIALHRILKDPLKIAKGDFISIIEGDDYWINKNKIEIQLKELLRDNNINMSFHAAKKINSDGGESILGQYSNSNGYIERDDILSLKYGMIPTASTVYKKEVFTNIYRFLCEYDDLTFLDIYFQILSSLNGSVYYINDYMSVYRYQSEGSWTSNLNNEIIINNIKSRFKMLEIISEKYEICFEDLHKSFIKKNIRSDSVDILIKDYLFNKHSHYFSIYDVFIYKLHKKIPFIFLFLKKLKSHV